MKKLDVALPELAFVAGTRAIAGAGIGMLVAGLLDGVTRRRLGWTLVAIGVLTTIPIALEVLHRRRDSTGEEAPPAPL